MSQIRSKNTKPEIKLRSLLWSAGYRFRKHYDIAGKPDIVFPGKKVAIFVDGEFWHGKDFDQWKAKLGKFWLRKISDNIKRDRKINILLRKSGWKVVHVWGKNVMKHGETVVRRIDRKTSG